jgi:O-antigen/teichoic acid export membrane protein
MWQSFYTWLQERYHWLFKNPLVRRVIKNSSYLFSATGAAAAISMLQGILVARLLGVAGYGILGTIILFTSVINKFCSFRMSEFVIKYVGHYNQENDDERAAAIFKTAAILEVGASLVAFVLILLLAPLGARFFAKDGSATAYFMAYGLIVLANLMTESSTGLLQFYDRFRYIGILLVLQSFVTFSLILVIYFKEGGFLEILLAYVVGKTFGALGLSIAAIREANRQWSRSWWRVNISVIRPVARDLLNFAVSTNISATINLVNKDGDLLWVSLLRGPLEAGYYRLAMSLINIVQMPVSPLPPTTYPELSREAASKNWNNFRQILKQGSRLAGSYTSVAVLFLVVFGKPLIARLYGAEYLPAYPALMILMVGFLVANTFYWNRIALLSVGLPEFPMKVNSILAVFKVIGIVIFVPMYGYLASAVLLTGYYVSSVTAAVIKLRSVLKLRDNPTEA